MGKTILQPKDGSLHYCFPIISNRSLHLVIRNTYTFFPEESVIEVSQKYHGSLKKYSNNPLAELIKVGRHEQKLPISLILSKNQELLKNCQTIWFFAVMF